MQRKTFLQRLLGGGLGLSLFPSAHGDVSLDPKRLATSWDAVRAQFPLNPERLYLNTGGYGPASQPVLEAMATQNAEQAVSGEKAYGLFAHFREKAAAFIGADPAEVCFVRNATEGNSIIAAGLDLKPGDEVIFEDEAHPGGSFAWMNQQKLRGVKVVTFSPDHHSAAATLQRLADAITPRTRVIQLSHVTAPTGLRFDVAAVAKLAHEKGIWFLLDGAQTLGMFPFDLHAIGCDSYAASGHKWLNGPTETGLLYVRRDRIDPVQPQHVGAYSESTFALPDVFSYHPTMVRHEYGTRNAGTLAGLMAAMELQLSIGRARIAAHGQALVARCRHRLQDLLGLEILTPRDPAMHGSILTVRVAGKTAEQLTGPLGQDFNIRARPVSELDLNAVRFSWHVYHQEADVDRLTAAMQTICT